jgi:hypothetical protein
MSDRSEPPPIAEMTFAQLLEAVALNGDMATYLTHKDAASDEESDANRAEARRHYDRRNACMRELLRRHAGETERDR